MFGQDLGRGGEGRGGEGRRMVKCSTKGCYKFCGISGPMTATHVVTFSSCYVIQEKINMAAKKMFSTFCLKRRPIYQVSFKKIMHRGYRRASKKMNALLNITRVQNTNHSKQC